MADASGDVLTAQLGALETAIVGTIETLDRLDEFTQPSPTIDNDGLKLNM